MATVYERQVSDFDLVLSWLRNQRVRVDPTGWTGKASIYAHHCDPVPRVSRRAEA